MFNKTYKGLGLMSGSSLDGLDIAYCEFTLSNFSNKSVIKEWQILEATTLPFDEDWIEKLKKAPELSGKELAELDAELGRYLGVQTLIFIGKHQLEPDFIASHGHTVFHYPDKEFTLQIGGGAAIAAITGYPVIDNFRAQDVALSGQGAPLAPMADEYLFGEYDICLNIGGIANLSVKTEDKYIAFDIGGANQVLNAIVNPLGWPYDDGGRFAEVGQLNQEILDEVNKLNFFSKVYPKSLGNNWVVEKLIPIYNKFDGPIEDKLHTACIQLANQVAKDIKSVLKDKLKKDTFKMLITGGGALNEFLVKCIDLACLEIGEISVEVPDELTIEYKEAALMALLGVLRLENLPTSMTSVTGARENAIGGAVHQGWKVQV
jgi:anhydro-N-acetylmuramic acid kinase